MQKGQMFLRKEGRGVSGLEKEIEQRKNKGSEVLNERKNAEKNLMISDKSLSCDGKKKWRFSHRWFQ